MTDKKYANEAIAHDEVIVRAAIRPYHFNGKKLSPKYALHPPAGSDSVSAIRSHLCNEDRCKRIGIDHVQNLEAKPKPKEYCGLWTIQAACIRKSGADVKVTEGAYAEHVSIFFGVVRPKNDPLTTPAEIVAYNEVVDNLAGHMQYFEDGDPTAESWAGGPLSHISCVDCQIAGSTQPDSVRVQVGTEPISSGDTPSRKLQR